MSVTADSPGKVLVAGGYLVLEKDTPGLVISATARFRARLSIDGVAAAGTPAGLATFEELHHAAVAAAAAGLSAAGRVPVIVYSPQFHAWWLLWLASSGDGDVPMLELVRDAEDGDVASYAAVVQRHAPSGFDALKLRSRGRNPYVDNAVNTALLAAAGAIGERTLSAALAKLAGASAALVLGLFADNDFYSQRAHLLARGLPVCSESLASLPAHLPCPVDDATGKPIVNKTGLGSSAALVTTVTAAVLAALVPPTAQGPLYGTTGTAGASATLSPAETARRERVFRRLVHDAAQVAHGLAQGKVGSGFDVCAAVYGSIRYTRIPPTVLGSAMERAEAAISLRQSQADASGASAAAAARARIASLFVALARQADDSSTAAGAPSLDAADAAVVAQWGFTVRAFGLPAGLRLLLADVAGGSETPGMVRQVLAWRDKDATANAAAGAADACTESVAKALVFTAVSPFAGAAAGAAAGASATGTGTSVPAAAATAASAIDATAASIVTKLLFAAASPAAGLELATADAAAAVSGGAAVAASGSRCAYPADTIRAMVAAAAAASGPALWRSLAAANVRVECALQRLQAVAAAASADAAGAEAYAAALSACAAVGAQAWADIATSGTGLDASVAAALCDVCHAFAVSRAFIRLVGEAAGVPIEPAAQTALADATAALPGVVAAGVPGAGGYDALFAIMIEPTAAAATVAAAVEGLWLKWQPWEAQVAAASGATVASDGFGLTPLLLRNGPACGSAGAGVCVAYNA